MSENPRRKRALINLLRVLITAIGITIIVTQVDLHATWEGIRQADQRLVLLSLAIFQAGMVIRAARWHALLRALGSSTTLLKLTGLYYIGAFFNTFLPTGFGGDVVRAAETTAESGTETAIVTVVVDRLSGLMVLFVIALGALLFGVSELPAELRTAAILISVVGLAGGVLVLLTGIPGRLADWAAGRIRALRLGGVAHAVHAVHRLDRRAVGLAMLASLAFNVVLIASATLIARSLALDVSLATIITVTLVGSLLLLIPSIQGIGVREPVYVLLLGTVGVEAGRALAFSLGIYALNLSTGLVGGAYYAIYSVVKLVQSRRA